MELHSSRSTQHDRSTTTKQSQLEFQERGLTEEEFTSIFLPEFMFPLSCGLARMSICRKTTLSDVHVAIAAKIHMLLAIKFSSRGPPSLNLNRGIAFINNRGRFTPRAVVKRRGRRDGKGDPVEDARHGLWSCE